MHTALLIVLMQLLAIHHRAATIFVILFNELFVDVDVQCSLTSVVAHTHTIFNGQKSMITKLSRRRKKINTLDIAR